MIVALSNILVVYAWKQPNTERPYHDEVFSSQSY
jgi:hypothetical protein